MSKIDISLEGETVMPSVDSESYVEINVPQTTQIAEDVARVNPDLVVRDDNGEIYTVRYDAVNAMLRVKLESSRGREGQ